MLSLQTEMLCECVQQAEPLLQLHYAELVRQQSQLKLSPRWDQYAALERAGMYRVFTARAGGELVGYAGFFTHRHLNFSATSSAVNDVLFLHPAHRAGRNGIRLIKFCERSLVDAGADLIVWSAKLNTGLAAMLRRLGYQDEELVLSQHF